MLEAGAHHVKKIEANTQLLPKIRELLGEATQQFGNSQARAAEES
jgi:hypothetical protein